MKTSISSIALAVIGVTSLAFAIPLSAARAQQREDSAPVQGQRKLEATPRAEQKAEPAQAVPGPPGVPFEGGYAMPAPSQAMPGGPPPMQMWGGGGMGGPAVMVVDGMNLYILRGDRLYKVNKGNLSVTLEGILPDRPPMINQGFNNQWGNRTGAPGAPGAGPRSGGQAGGQRGGKQAK